VEATLAWKQRPPLRADWLGRIAYDRALELQLAAAERAGRGEPEALLLLEHEAVFTLGRNGSTHDILLTAQQRLERGIAVRESNRGGKVTYHGPGQLVGYPILNLSPDRRDVKRYVTDLEEVLIRTLMEFGIRGERSERKERVSSVWVGEDKIAAIGIHLSRWVTTHGFALNVTGESLAPFEGIVPCGIHDGGVTAMERHAGRPLALGDIVPPLLAHFGSLFGREIILP
jgi:lipoyl(octanoyl) transferase